MTQATQLAAPGALSSRSLDSALRHDAADMRIYILRLTGESGSISQAARDAGVSYKAAWQAIDTLTNLAGMALVERVVGGAGGGGAKLTPAGQHLLAVANRLAASRAQLLGQMGGAAPGRMAAHALAHLGLRTSMRNQLPCTVNQVTGKGQLVLVQLQLAGNATLLSRITKVSAELLGLLPGLAVVALCKATAVVVTAQAQGVQAPDEANTECQGLNGQATRISRGAMGDEVSLQLDGGLQLVGFAATGSSLKSRAHVTAQIDASALVIAVAP